MPRKIICDEIRCDWRGYVGEELIAVNPFDLDEDIRGCPQCKSINTIVYACDEPGCWNRASGGEPYKDGYRWYCYKHNPY